MHPFSVLLSLGLQFSFAPWAVAQYLAAPGFAADTVFREVAQLHRVVGVAADVYRGGFFEAVDNVLFYHPDTSNWSVAHLLPAGEVIGALRFCEADSHLYFTALHAGTVFDFDPATLIATAMQGVANGFDLAFDSQGAVLLAANPNWPQSYSTSGIWRIAPGQPPRLLLQLSGPSAPLCFDRHDNLVTAELGAVVPPPPGGVRLLRFPAARLAAVLQQPTAQLLVADADLIGNGWNGAFGLAVDDLDHVYVTDPASHLLHRAAAGTLQPEAAPFCVLPGYGLQLQFVSSHGDPWRAMRAWQPGAQTSTLLVGNCDFVNEYAVARLHPERPQLAATPNPALAAGVVTLRCTGAPPAAAVWFAIAAPWPWPEQVIAFADGTPLWLGLPAASLQVAGLAFADNLGTATLRLQHPGGFAATLAAQALALGAPGSGAHGTSTPMLLNLLP